ncbi:polysaccharide biosynthesis protein [Clostridium grantii]|uniref:NDP-sugar epimerase, includes UDP-GlcNAc-inverting 4,6-dehydratase FlaA1 and capsular polysaccharide biosynthesis protein EpsC n=1 Tax=Clostridium grantii DSM 8605 TaxID=1121316 RepID=A0A1M5UZL7_9CLOT|nr:nucleoside-diphosphate sugar epimerase/dehydratase [Clostridium grantii]SHH68133.1 NDP-sugar epimerase, includes UDP-GlcNAc-inverting 4,6-dehydratase FlaA1 and capsular polysaccharide biosynthesis protein EpsC [Clostridium grantii DSM 8605]
MKKLFNKIKIRQKKIILLISDIIFVNVGYLFVLFLFNERYKGIFITAFLVTSIYISIFTLFRLYDSLWKVAGSYEFFNVIKANLLSWGIFYGVNFYMMNSKFDFVIYFIFFIFTLSLTFSFRICYRFLRRYMIFSYGNSSNCCKVEKRVMIIGAGYTGSLIIKEMLSNKQDGYNPVVIIDDDKSKWGNYINKVKIVGGRNKIIPTAISENIDVIVIAIAKIQQTNKKSIINICKNTGCKLKIIPSYNEILNEKVFLSKIRDVNVEDLLGRDPVQLDMENISDYIKDKTVLVTGGGGSIGSEICRQVSKFKPKKLLVLDIYENNAYDLQNELKTTYSELDMQVIIASVRDKNRLENIFAKYRPEVVFHAAAHKHVPLMEENPGEAIKNNIFGTLNTAECADKFGVKKFVLISTDKAVNPTNIMGATKRVCEMIVQSMNNISETSFVAVRFGNVLGSNGSVIPLFKNQIRSGGPVTLTHKDIIRFFMTIPEAAQLVLQAGAYANGGEIFVLDMGPAVKIYDLACDLIKLSGLEPNKDIKIEITGLRPGEKLYEELLMDGELNGQTKHNKIYIGKVSNTDFYRLRNKLNRIRLIISNEDDELIYAIMKDLVPTFNPKCMQINSNNEEFDFDLEEGNVAVTLE